jgi:hypothetical protein
LVTRSTVGRAGGVVRRSRSAEGGPSVPAVAEQLGHANLKNTAVDLQLADPRRAELIERVPFA